MHMWKSTHLVGTFCIKSIKSTCAGVMVGSMLLLVGKSGKLKKQGTTLKKQKPLAN